MDNSNYIGRRYGKLVVISIEEDYISPTGGKHAQFKCKCDCGRETIVLKEALTSGRTTSCGCYRKRKEPRGKKSEDVGTRLYRIWGNMLNRCNNPNNPKYKDYGARGIRVCSEWQSFVGFKEWALKAGYKDNLTIDRTDNNGSYEPNNCRWVDDIIQANNKRNNKLIEYNGEIQTIAEWARTLGMPYKTLAARIERGWEVERAFTQPLR